MLFLVFFIVVALLVALKGNKKFILFFMAFYPVLPDYFAIELGGGLPLLKASRILLLILMLCVCFHNKKIHLIRQTSLDKGTQRKTTENELPSLTQCTA